MKHIRLYTRPALAVGVAAFAPAARAAAPADAAAAQARAVRADRLAHAQGDVRQDRLAPGLSPGGFRPGSRTAVAG
jgi:hypothetical protein